MLYTPDLLSLFVQTRQIMREKSNWMKTPTSNGMKYSGHATFVETPVMQALSHWITHSSVVCQMWYLRWNNAETEQREQRQLVTEKNAEAEWMIPEKDPTPNTGLLENLFPHSSATQDYLFPRLQAWVWLTAIRSDPYKTLSIQQILNIFLFIEMSTQSTNCYGQGISINTDKVLRQ